MFACDFFVISKKVYKNISDLPFGLNGSLFRIRFIEWQFQSLHVIDRQTGFMALDHVNLLLIKIVDFHTIL